MRKIYQFGDILITAKYTDDFTIPELWGDEIRPLYYITLRDKNNNKIRHTVKAWGNIADAPDTQHQSLAGLVVEEHLRNYGSFKAFCGEFGYDMDSRKAEKIYNKLVKCWNNGIWQELAGEELVQKWERNGKDLEDFLKLEKIKA